MSHFEFTVKLQSYPKDVNYNNDVNENFIKTERTNNVKILQIHLCSPNRIEQQSNTIN